MVRLSGCSPSQDEAKLLRIGVQGVFGAAALDTRLPKVCLGGGIVARERPGVLIGFGLAHQSHASAGLSQAGDAELAGRLQRATASVPGQGSPGIGTSQTNEGVRSDGSSAERGRAGHQNPPSAG